MATLKSQHMNAQVSCQTRPRQRRHMDQLMSHGRKVQVVLTRVDLMVSTPVSITIVAPLNLLEHKSMIVRIIFPKVGTYLETIKPLYVLPPRQNRFFFLLIVNL